MLNFLIGVVIGFAEMHFRVALSSQMQATSENMGMYIPLVIVSAVVFIIGYKIMSWQRILLIVLSLILGIVAHVYLFENILGTFEHSFRTSATMIHSAVPSLFVFAAGMFGVAVGGLRNKKATSDKGGNS